MIKILFSMAVTLFGVAPLLGHPPITWETHYEKALKQSKEEQKPLLLFFNGSDWSGWGMKVKKEILTTQAFAEKLGGQFICVEVDFPMHVPLANELKMQNQGLKEKWGVSDYPRLVLIDPDERQIAHLGYSGEESDHLACELLGILESDRSLSSKLLNINNLNSKELQSCYMLAQDLQRKEAIALVLEAGLKSDCPLFFMLEKYRHLSEEGKGHTPEAIALRKELLAVDPHNKEEVPFSIALIDFQERSRSGAAPSEVIKPLEDYLAAFGASDPENSWRVEMILVQYYLDFDECTLALKHAETAYQKAPAPMREEIGRSVNYIKKQSGS